MAKFNTPAKAAKAAPAAVVTPPKGVIGTKKSGARLTTGEGHLGYERKDKSALFLLAAASLGGEDKFYESGEASTQRLVDLVRRVAVKDPEWTAAFLRWLRSEGNIRTASVVGGVEAADALAKAQIPGGRQILASVLQRADEPGEAMAYWLATRKGPEGRRVIMPISIKRALADALGRLYNEYSLMKYDSDRAAVRFGDVIDMVHPDPAQVGWKSGLYRHALARRHGRDMSEDRNLPESLVMIRAQRDLRARFGDDPSVLLDTEALKAAGMTWEDALSLAGPKLDKGKIWASVLPTLGYMALIRNLRNLDEAGVSDADVAPAIVRLQDPEQVAKSRQFPYRLYSAYKNAPSLRWGQALEVALGLSLKNIPALGGRTLILIDTSGSMSGTNPSARSTMTYQEIAGLFGIALGMKGEADVYGWADRPFHFPMGKGSSVLKNLNSYMAKNGVAGHGTNLEAAFRGSYEPGKYSRVVVISDMQVMGYSRATIPTDVPCYFFNLGGYAPAAVQTTGKVYELGGLTDHTFKMITMLEAGDAGKWPWEE